VYFDTLTCFTEPIHLLKRSSVAMNGHSEAQILIVDAGAQYGKVRALALFLSPAGVSCNLFLTLL